MWHLRTWWRYLAVLCSWLDWIILKAFSNLNDFMFLYRKQRTPSAFTFLALIIMSRTALHYPEKPRSSSLSNIYWDVSRNRRYFFAVRCNIFNLPLCGGFWTGAETFVLLDCWKTFGCSSSVYVRSAQNTWTVVHAAGWQRVSTVPGITLGCRPCSMGACAGDAMEEWCSSHGIAGLWQQCWENSISACN